MFGPDLILKFEDFGDAANSDRAGYRLYSGAS